MKTRNYALIVAIALAAGTVACKKSKSTAPTTTTTTPTTTAAGPTPPSPTPSGTDISGGLISIQMKYTTQPTGSPMPFDLNSEIGFAIFYSAPGSSTRVDAGTVSVNSNNLDKQTDNSYYKLAYTGGTPSSLGFGTSSSWNVGGSSGVTAFTYDHTAAFPDYTGTVPTSITKSIGVTLTFNSSTLANADSVYVVIAAGSKSVTKSFAGNAGTVTISSSDLSILPAVADNTGIFEVCPFNSVVVAKNGKNYACIKEQAVVKNININ